MVICTSITESYLEKSKPFFESVHKHFIGKRICFCIGFTCEIEGWETVNVPLPLSLKFNPSNRPGFSSLQHGEFIKHYKFNRDEMILFCDSDMVLQREWDLDFPVTDHILVTRSSFPALKLFQVVKNLNCKKRADKFFDKYKFFIEKEFCTAFIIAKASTWEKLYYKCESISDMLDNFDHHAALQLLINVAANKITAPIILHSFICNAGWYEGTKAVIENDLLKDGEEIVYFNHTKFN